MEAGDHEMDSMDWKLVNLLAEDASRPTAIAAELGCSPEEFQRRTGRLLEQGVIREIAGRVAPAALGFPFAAFYAVRVAQNADTFGEVERLLRDIEQVEEAHAISGQYDWLVKARGQTLEELQDVLTHRLSLLPGFVRAETMVVLSTACEHLNVDAALHPPS